MRVKHSKEFCDADTLRRIAQRRVDLHMTQKQLAEKLGYSMRTYVSRVEVGTLPLSTERLPRWAELLDTTVEYLLTGNEEDSQAVVADTVLDSIVSNYKKLSEDERALLLDFSKVLVKGHK